MGRIRLLSDALASQVAAGEVVERPASVVKELVENSVDAEARKIEVRVQRGGMSLIRVVDDGIGMSRDDALMCLERHATSKIRSTEDLDGIGTLGFRGEAIPSIASVSKFRLATREKDALSGTEILVNGGKVHAVKDCGEPPGTQIDVRSLFYNIPARRKFLRTENTEFSHLEHTVRVIAIAHPGIAFTLIRNEHTSFQLPATERHLERIRGLVGGDIASRLLEVVPVERNGVRVHGFIGGFGMGRSNRQMQLTFLNGRPVEASMLNYALREGYHTALMKGQYPITFLFLEMSPFAVDVNVHPAKKEVRFRDGNSVRDVVIEAISRTLEESRATIPGQQVRKFPEAPAPVVEPTTPELRQTSLIPEREQISLRKDWMQSSPSTETQAPSLPEVEQKEEPLPPPVESTVETEPHSEVEVPEESATDRVRPEDFRIIGVLGKLYVLMESREGMVVMDQHAAHERILFEKMRRRMENEGVPSQRLLMPLTVELAPKDFDLVNRHLDALQKLGIGAETFGSNTIKVDGLPQFLKTDDPSRLFSDVIRELRATSERMSSMRLGEDMVATTVCRYAVKANDYLQFPELDRLLEDLLACELPYCCPHGRPTIIQMSFAELEKKFGRTL